jgi:LysM repeat protein
MLSGTGSRRAPKPHTARRVVTTAGIGVAIPLIGAVAASAADSYTVKQGDTLSEIAAQHKLKDGWQGLYNDNKSVVGGDADLIKPGQKLTLDGDGKPVAPRQQAAPAPAKKSSASDEQRVVTHTVKPGETLASIAKKYGVPGGWQRLLQDNKSAISDPAQLRVGTKLKVDKDGRAVAAKQRSSTQTKKESRPTTRPASTASKAPSGSPQSIARAVVPAGQFQCFSSIVERESGWNPRATNASSGAYGLMQALPGSKMASAGADWRTNPATQIKWGLNYMNSRYGSPCGAWNFWQNNHWY